MDDSQVIKYAYADSTNRDVTIYPSGSEYTAPLDKPDKEHCSDRSRRRQGSKHDVQRDQRKQLCEHR